jgi:hypothetical protein
VRELTKLGLPQAGHAHVASSPITMEESQADPHGAPPVLLEWLTEARLVCGNLDRP